MQYKVIYKDGSSQIIDAASYAAALCSGSPGAYFREVDPQQRNFDRSTENSIRGSGWNRSPSGLGCRPESTRWPLAPSGMARTSSVRRRRGAGPRLCSAAG
jgi:hypothetical protein